MAEFLISPAERAPITNLGQVSSLPERVGCDIVWGAPKGIAGVQRKAVLDLIASVRDGRLGREVEQMKAAKLTAAFVVIEGRLNYNAQGKLMSQHVQWTRNQQYGVELSLQRQGVAVLHTSNPMDTVATCEYLYEKTQKETEHMTSLLARPNAATNGWGKLTDRDYAIHVMSGMEQISLVLAGRIFDHYGKFPCVHDLLGDPPTNVHGIGSTRARSIMRAFGYQATEVTG